MAWNKVAEVDKSWKEIEFYFNGNEKKSASFMRGTNMNGTPVLKGHPAKGKTEDGQL